MADFLEMLKDEDNFTTTENGAAALKSTKNACLDAFSALPAATAMSEEYIIRTFSKAFAEDRALAMRILFYVRDIRGGQGMRRVFRVCLKWLADNYPEYVKENLGAIMEYGRADDYLCLEGTCVWAFVISLFYRILRYDFKCMKEGKPISLLGKWLPSENASSKETRRLAKKVREGFDLSSKQYRQLLSRLRAYSNVTETYMSAREWDEIDYEEVPARASLNYSDAFYRHDEKRYIDFIEGLAKGQSKINAKSLFPVDIIKKAFEKRYKCSAKDRIILNSMWEALPNYLEGVDETALCMVDTSCSMWGTPYDVAVSLGIYCADKCRGPFHNHFLTFAEHPALCEITGKDIVEKVANLPCINAGNTDLEAAFDLILRTAVDNNVKPEDLPSKLYVISDMQFDAARSSYTYNYLRPSVRTPLRPFMQTMKEKFTAAGYTLPSIVYWNVRAGEGMYQETFEGESCAIVGGYSPSLFEAIIKGTTYTKETIEEDGVARTVEKIIIDPMEVMYAAVASVRYAPIYPSLEEN